MFTEGHGTNDENIPGVNGLGRQQLDSVAIYFGSCHWSVPGRGDWVGDGGGVVRGPG
jgi:hypothetical protein